MARDELLRYGIISLVGIDNVLCARAYRDPPMSQLILSLHLLLVKSIRPTLQCRVVRSRSGLHQLFSLEFTTAALSVH